ncbi:MAG TPA: CHAT domain-containing protein [Longimicrobium sp.]|jgi:CHAT domain-containing protein
MSQSSLRLSPRAALKRWPLLLLGGATALAVMTIGTRRWSSHATVLDELAAARPSRVLSPRFSIPVEYHPCFVLPAEAADETVPRESCGADDGRLARFEALDDAGESSDPDSLQASALVAIIGDDDTEQAADAAITRLSRALRLSPRRVPLLVDLSGAHLVRAQRTQNSLDLLKGLDYALEAVEAEPQNLEARFNAALAMQTLGLDEQAEIAWTDYLSLDSTSKWADEARKRRSFLRHPPMAQEPRPGAPEAEVRAFATQNPQEARLLGTDSVLGRWGRALEAGDTARAAKLLQLAEDLGIALRDLSLMDEVGVIRAARDDPAAIRTLAQAHRMYTAGQAMYWRLEQVAAGDSFARVVSVRPPSPVLVRSAEVFHASALAYGDDFSGADSKLRALLLRIDSVRYPALAARALWIRGTVQLKNGQPAPARASYRAAARLFARASETEYAGATLSMEGEAAYNQRDTLAAYRSIHRGITSLRAYRGSPWLASALLVLANCASVDGMPRAAAVIQDENFSVSMRVKEELPNRVEALLGRARVHAAAGRREDAGRDLDHAESFMEKIRAREPREFLGHTARYSRALIGTDTGSTVGLDSAVAYFDSINAPIWLLPALLRRADVHLAQGKIGAASSDLTYATSRIRGLSQKQADAALRVAMLEQARSRFDQLVTLHLRAGDTIAALQAVERSRVSFTPGYDTSTVVQGRLAAPPGQVAVEYALIGDTLLTWTVRGNDVRVVRHTLDRGDFLRRIERVVAGLESRRAESALPDLERLYDSLIRPVEHHLGPSGTPLVILADGEVIGVPFEALRDSSSRRYLVEDHPLRFAATLAEAARPAPAADRSAHALFIADPAFDVEQYPTLDPLKGARAEVDSLKALYPSNQVLEGAAATRPAVIQAATRAGIIHYAGHALFDDTRPERSALVLAGADTTGRLTAEAVNALQLRGVRLVVLAACRTARAREGRSGGLAGFSGALLAAGAGGVVGRLWDTNDRLTQPFMLAFHRAYAHHPDDPAAALREAQLEMLRSSDPTRSSLATWAGFRYIGS